MLECVERAHTAGCLRLRLDALVAGPLATLKVGGARLLPQPRARAHAAARKRRGLLQTAGAHARAPARARAVGAREREPADAVGRAPRGGRRAGGHI